MSIKDSRGFWNLVKLLEASAEPNIAKMLEPFSTSIIDLYECGVEVCTLIQTSHAHHKYLGVVGLFLKRLLNDIRSVWILLTLGYTSEAGAIAAASFENALIIICITEEENRAKRLLEYGGSPWSIAELCKMYARQWGKSDKKEQGENDIDNDIDYETVWRGNYAIYQWLCKLKHPHMASVLHDAYSVSIEGRYGIMAAPDDRIEDLPNKAGVLSAIILYTHTAIKNLAKAGALDYKDEKGQFWQKRFDSIVPNYARAMEPIRKNTELPFDYMGRMKRKDKK